MLKIDFYIYLKYQAALIVEFDMNPFGYEMNI